MIPVFIGGCGRSGTTLLGSLVGSHSECITVPESQFKFHLLGSSPDHVRGPGELLEYLRGHWSFRAWSLSDGALESAVREGLTLRDLMVQLVRAYGLEKLNKTGSVWVDHTPDTFNHAIRLAEHFPDCKFIHIVRDGRAVAASVLPLPWGPNTAADAAQWWVQRVAYGMAARKHFEGQARFLDVFYHDLVREPVRTVEAIQDFIGLPREEPILEGRDSFLLPNFTKDQHTLVHRPPDPSRIDAWKEKLTVREIERFETVAGVMLDYLGFERLAEAPIRPESNAEAVKSKVFKLYKGFLDRRRWSRWLARDGS